MQDQRNEPKSPPDPRRRLLLGIALSAFAVVIASAVVLLRDDSQAPGSPFEQGTASSKPDARSETQILEQLEKRLVMETGAREELAQRIADLEAMMMLAGFEFDGGGGHSSSSAAAELEDSDSEGGGDEAEALDSQSIDRVSKFDDEALLSLGADPRDVDRLRERWVEQQLEVAALSHQALREGWYQQQRHRAENIGLELALRKDLEESDYDRYLYASGRPNSLEAGEVLAGGSANYAGLRKGDVILRYDDVRIFGPGDLLVASSRGEAGSSVRMEILREGRRRTLYIDRGPLGALMNHNRALPLED